MADDASCNVAGCDHTRPEECEVVRCATCNEPYDGTEAPAAHIARAHLDILARERRATRVRTQAERDADGTAWRRDLIGVRTADGRLYAPEDVALVYPNPRPPAPPRRRWWHRLTRRG